MALPVVTDIVDARGEAWLVSAANRGETPVTGRDGFAQVANARMVDCLPSRAGVTPGYTLTGGTLAAGHMMFFSREPAGLLRADGQQLWFAGARSVEHTGHRIFHGNFNNRTGAACASCHAEGGDDGLVWNFSQNMQFRTPSLRGTIGDTGPYHWRGELTDIPDLAAKVFSTSMGGPVLSSDHTARLKSWLEALPSYAQTPVGDGLRESISRGEEVFRSREGNCVMCHSGPRFTNNQTMHVGTGGSFQVPSLVGVRFRGPFMHNGCAATLDVRFESMGCGGNMHGGFGLTAVQTADLTAYLLSI